MDFRIEPHVRVVPNSKLEFNEVLLLYVCVCTTVYNHSSTTNHANYQFIAVSSPRMLHIRADVILPVQLPKPLFKQYTLKRRPFHVQLGLKSLIPL